MKNCVFLTLFVFVSVLLHSCKYEPETQKESITGDITGSYEEPQQVREIFYNLYKPGEMSRIFQKAGANFDPELAISPDHFAQYRKPWDIAVALGIYGVDLHYARLFERDLMVARYFTVIQILSEKLGIPQEYYEDVFNEMEEEFPDQDSLSQIVSGIYEKTDKYLKENDQDVHAALIVMGSWVEALYIACNILESNPYNTEIMDRISEQKYSLNSLINLLSNYQNDIRMTEYILMLKRLRKAFARYEIYFEREDFSLDTGKQIITVKDYQSDFNESIVREITMVTEEIRENLVN